MSSGTKEIHNNIVTHIVTLFEQLGWHEKNLILRKEKYNPSIVNPKKETLDALKIFHQIQLFFDQENTTKRESVPLTGNYGTFFISSGIQAIDDFLKRKLDFSGEKAFYMAQPVIRLNSLGQINQGYLSSFVNVSRIQIKPSIEEHLRRIDDFLSLISSLGMHCNQVYMEIEASPNYRHPNYCAVLRFYYKKVEIADAVFLWNETDSSICASEIGFGLERVLYAMDKSSFYHCVFGNFVAHHDSQDANDFDYIRTIVLMISARIGSVKKSDQVNKLRFLMKKIEISKFVYGIDLVLKYYYDYWSIFIVPKLRFNEVLHQFNKLREK